MCTNDGQSRKNVKRRVEGVFICFVGAECVESVEMSVERVDLDVIVVSDINLYKREPSRAGLTALLNGL